MELPPFAPDEPEWITVQRRRRIEGRVRLKAIYAVQAALCGILVLGAATAIAGRPALSYAVILPIAATVGYHLRRSSDKGTFWSSFGFQLAICTAPLGLIAIVSAASQG